MLAAEANLFDLLLNPQAGPIVAVVVALFPLAWMFSSLCKLIAALMHKHRSHCE